MWPFKRKKKEELCPCGDVLIKERPECPDCKHRDETEIEDDFNGVICCRHTSKACITNGPCHYWIDGAV